MRTSSWCYNAFSSSGVYSRHTWTRFQARWKGSPKSFIPKRRCSLWMALITPFLSFIKHIIMLWRFAADPCNLAFIIIGFSVGYHHPYWFQVFKENGEQLRIGLSDGCVLQDAGCKSEIIVSGTSFNRLMLSCFKVWSGWNPEGCFHLWSVAYGYCDFQEDAEVVWVDCVTLRCYWRLLHSVGYF